MSLLIDGATNATLSACPVCGTSYAQVGHRFVVFAAGALRRTGPASAEMDSQLTGFVDLLWHDHESGGGHVPLVNDAPAGQAEIYVCTPACLRALFNRWADALETALANRKASPTVAIGDTKESL